MEMNVDKNEIEERCLPLTSLNELSTEWIAKVMLLSVSKGPKPGEPHVLLFADSEKTIMQAVMFSRDYKSMGFRLKPMQTVYLGNSKISLIENSKHQYGNVPYQIHMNMKTLFEPVDEGASHELSDCVDITPFWEIDAHQEKEDDLYNILGSIVHMLPPRTVNSQGGLSKVQEFVLLNQECRPMILTFWGSYSAPELSEMINLMHTRPVVLLVSLILGTFNGTCVEAHNHTKIILNPPLSQTNPLITWVTEHKDYVHHVISNELYKKENQEVRKPSEDNVWQIHQVLNLQKPTKNCWVKATISIVELSQSVSKSL